jgi:hypothetical protein
MMELSFQSALLVMPASGTAVRPSGSVVRHTLKEVQYRPGLINGCLAVTGLNSNPDEHYEFNLFAHAVCGVYP